MRATLALLVALVAASGAVAAAGKASPTLYTYTITAPSGTLERVNGSPTKGRLTLHDVNAHAIWVGTDGGAGVIALGGLLSSAFRSGNEWLASPAAVLIDQGPDEDALAPPPASAAGNVSALRAAYDDEDAIVLRLRNGRVDGRDLTFDVDVLSTPDAAPGSSVATTYLQAANRTDAILTELPPGKVKLNSTALIADDHAKVSPGSHSAAAAAAAPAPAVAIAQPARKLQGFVSGVATGVGFGVGYGITNAITSPWSNPCNGGWRCGGGCCYPSPPSPPACANGCWQCNGNQCCCNPPCANGCWQCNGNQCCCNPGK